VGSVIDALADMPREVRVGAHDVSIRTFDWREAQTIEADGYFERAKQEIGVFDGLVTATRVGEILMHEINHAICWAYRVDDDADEETFVGMMALAWSALYRDNPSFLPWLAAAFS
jgi:hypothetical protein